MNKVFKVIWNHATQTWTAVSELGHAKGKTKSKKIVKLTALAGAVLTSLGVSQVAQASVDLGNSAVNISPNGTYNGSNRVGKDSIVVGYQNTANNEWGTTALGANNTAIANAALAVGNNNQATGGASTAMGVSSIASGEASVAIGNVAQATQIRATAVGNRATATQDSASAFGNRANASAQFATAIGDNSHANAAAVAVGTHANAEKQDSIAIGNNAHGAWTNAIAVGKDSVASQDHAIATGTSANASGVQAVGVGSYTKAEGNLTVAVGPYAQANKEAAIAVGSNATATETNSVAVGQTATASKNNAIAIGTKTKADGDNAVGIGAYTESNGTRSTAVGVLSQANGAGSFAGGASAQATGANSVAIGGAQDGTLGNKAGTAAKATGDNAVSIGTNATASIKDSVALGSNSTTSNFVPTNEATVGSLTYSGFAGNTSALGNGAVVSVGTAGSERQIQNVAAGRLTKTSTDAVNGSQLYTVANDLDDKINNHHWVVSGNSTVNAQPKESNVYHKDVVEFQNGKGTTATVVNTPANKSLGQAGKTVVQYNANIVNGENTEVVYNADGSVKINAKVSGGTDTTAAVTTGTTDALAVTNSTTGNVTTYNVDAKTGSISTTPVGAATYAKDGDKATGGNYGARLTNVSTVTDIVNNVSWHLNSSAVDGGKITEGSDTEPADVKASNTVNINAGKNIEIKRNGTTIEISSTAGAKGDTGATGAKGDTGATGAAGAKGDTGAKGEDGTSITGEVVDNGDGTHTITITDLGTGSVTTTIVKDGKNGKDGATGATGATGAAGKDGKNAEAKIVDNNNGTHTVTIVDGNGQTTSTIVKDGATGAKGEKGDTGAAGAKGDTGAAGKNAEAKVVDNNNGTHTVTIVDGNGQTTSTIVKDGATGAKGDTGAAGATGATGATGPKGDTGATGPKGDAGTTGAAGPEKHVDVVSGNENTTKVEVKANASKDGRDRFVVSANTTTTKVNDNGTVSVDPKGNGDSLVNATTVVNAINDASFNITTGNHVDKVVTDTNGSETAKVKPGSTVTITSGKNVAVNQTVDAKGNPTFIISTTADVTHNNVTASNIVATNVTAGDVTAENVTANNVTTKNITVENGGNIDMGGNQVHNVANGTEPTDAVNISQLKANTTKVVSGHQSNVTLVSDNADGKVYKVDVNTTELSNVTTNGDITVPAGNGLVTAKDVANAINSAYWKVADNDGNVQHNVTASNTVQFVNGKGTSSNVTKAENGKNSVSYNVNVGDGLYIDSNNKVAANVTDVKAGDNVTVNKDAKGVYTVSANNTQASVTTEPNKGITVTPTTNANGTTNYKVTVDIDNDTITVNNQGKLVSNGATNFNVSTVDKGNQVANKGGSSTARVTSGKSVTYAAGKNIAIEQNGTEILVSTTEDVNHNSVTTNNLTVNEGGNLKVGPNSTVDMGGNQIHNVKAGEKDTDAVNVSQLRNNITNVNNRINKVQKEARGGIAGANAAAGLPQVYIPGKSMVAASAGTFKGESALAVGYSRSSDNGKVILKLQGNANTQGDVGGSVGVGYQW